MNPTKVSPKSAIPISIIAFAISPSMFNKHTRRSARNAANNEPVGMLAIQDSRLRHIALKGILVTHKIGYIMPDAITTPTHLLQNGYSPTLPTLRRGITNVLTLECLQPNTSSTQVQAVGPYIITLFQEMQGPKPRRRLYLGTSCHSKDTSTP